MRNTLYQAVLYNSSWSCDRYIYQSIYLDMTTFMGLTVYTYAYCFCSVIPLPDKVIVTCDHAIYIFAYIYIIGYDNHHGIDNIIIYSQPPKGSIYHSWQEKETRQNKSMNHLLEQTPKPKSKQRYSTGTKTGWLPQCVSIPDLVLTDMAIVFLPREDELFVVGLQSWLWEELLLEINWSGKCINLRRNIKRRSIIL